MIIGSKNKGDWSEFYILLYLLGSCRLYAGDENLLRMDHCQLQISKIFRKETPVDNITFLLDPKMEKIDIYINGEHEKSFSNCIFLTLAQKYLPLIKQGKGSFDIPDAEKTLNMLHCKRLSASSSDITDIRLELHDPFTGMNQIMGFSIKSYLGGAPTLLNASGATNFIYEVSDIADDTMKAINAIETGAKIVDRIQTIYLSSLCIYFKNHTLGCPYNFFAIFIGASFT